MLYLLQTPTQFPKPAASQQFTITVTVPFAVVEQAIPFFLLCSSQHSGVGYLWMGAAGW